MKDSVIALLENKFKADVTFDRVRFNNSIEARLVDNGFKVFREAKHPFLENARVNYLAVSNDGEICIIEVDNRTPRGRSLEKIYSAKDNGMDGFVLLRDASLSKSYKSCGIDIVVARRV